jgi:hypothetical protein
LMARHLLIKQLPDTIYDISNKCFSKTRVNYG